MVDISGKSPSERVAVARGQIVMSTAAAAAVKQDTNSKGDVLQIARIAAIQGVKRTSDLIPLCHVLLIEKVTVEFSWLQPEVLRCEVEVKSSGKTGVEMEALTGVSIGLLAVYDMLKSVDKSMRIEMIELKSKSGGKSGTYQREGMAE